MAKQSFALRFGTVLLALWCCTANPTVAAAGDPLFNLRWLFETLFRLQFDSPEEIIRRSEWGNKNAPPNDINARRALHLKYHPPRRLKHLTCNDIAILGYRDWEVGFKRAKEARAKATDNRITPEMNWPNFVDWDSPAYVVLNIRRTFLGNLKSASLSVAVLGDDFDIGRVLDQNTGKIPKSNLQQLFAVRGRGFEQLHENGLSDKLITVSKITRCDGFSIFDLDVR